MSTGSVRAPAKSPISRSHASLELRLFALALLVRLVLFVAAHGLIFTDARVTDQFSFQNEATNIAASIADGHGFHSPFVGVVAGDPQMPPTSWLGPIYPYFVAAFFALFGNFSRQAFFCILLIQCVASALTAIPILWIGRMTVGRRPGLLAAFLWAVFPWFSRWPITWVWEITFSTLLVAWLFWFALKLERGATMRWWIGYGLLWGVALLLNPSLMTVLAVSALWAVVRIARRHAQWLRQALLSMLACAVVVSPWLIRNRLVFGQWVFIRSNFWFEFTMGNQHGGTGRDWNMRSPIANPAELAEYRRAGEPGYVGEKEVQGKHFLRAYPLEFVHFCEARFASYWTGSSIFFDTPVARFWLPQSYVPLSLLLVPALLLACVRRVPAWPLYVGCIALYPLPYYVAISQVRYRNAIEPLMLLLIAWLAFRLLPARWHEQSTAAENVRS